MIDADLTYDFEEIPNFVRQLDDGAELVMGNRMANIDPGAMSLTSRIGNPILSGFLNLVYRHADRRRALWAARDPARRAAEARPALNRDGVRVRDGDPGGARRPRHPRAADLVARPRRGIQALAPPRRLAAPPPHARVQPRLPLPDPRRGDGRRSALLIDRHGADEARRSSAGSSTSTRRSAARCS